MTFGTVCRHARRRGGIAAPRYALRQARSGSNAAMRPSLLAIAQLTVSLAACKGEAPTAQAPGATGESASAAQSQADVAFAALSKRYLDQALAFSPVAATQIGDHRFDSELDDLSAEGRARSAGFARKVLAE